MKRVRKRVRLGSIPVRGRRRPMSARRALRQIAELKRFRSEMHYEADVAEMMAIARAIEAIEYNQKARDRRDGARDAGFELKRARDVLRSAQRRESRAGRQAKQGGRR